MRKKTRLTLLTFLIMSIVLLTGIAFAGCKGDGGVKDGVSYTIVYDSNGGAAVKNGTYTTGKKFNLPTPSIGADPLMYGYSFVAWYYDEDCTVEVDSKNMDLSYATKDKVITLYAKWSNLHKIYFDTKTAQVIEPAEYAYGANVAVADLPVPDSRVVGETECRFLYWIQANNNEKRTEDFKMDAVDMYFYAMYDTGVNHQYTLDDEGNYIPLTANGHTTHTTYRDYRLTDGDVYSVDMIFPANWADYTDDCGPVFSATAFDEEGTTFEAGQFVTLYVSCQNKSNGAIQFWGNADDAEGKLTGTVCLGGYNLDGEVLKDTPYAEKFLAYTKSGEEETFTFTFRRVDETVGEGADAVTKATYYIGIDGIEYFKMTSGEKMEGYDVVTNKDYVVSEKLTGSIVGFRSKTLGVKFSKITMADADKATIIFDPGKGTMTGESSIEYTYGEELELPVPKRDGYIFYCWEYLDRTTGREVALTDGMTIDRSIWKLEVTAQWRRENAKPYAVVFDTGIDGYTVSGLAEWYEGNLLEVPTLRYPMYAYSGEWFYDAERTQKVDLEDVDLAKATVGEEGSAEQYITLYAGVEQREFLAGEGTEESPYLIGSAEDFAKLGTFVDEGMAFAGKYFKLTADFNLGSRTAIGSAVTPFSGTLDGDGHTITANVTGKDNIGLFAVLKAATIKNLNLDVTVTASGGSVTTGVGSIAGFASGATRIDNCTASGTITSSSVGGEGGFVGRVESGFKITNCINRISIDETSTGNSFTGGIIGNSNNGMITITGCKNYGTITAGGGFVGGIIGLMRIGGGTIADCENHGNVLGRNQVGGISGSLRANMTNCFVLETATVNGSVVTTMSVYGNRTSSGATSGHIGAFVGELDDNNQGQMPLGCGYLDAEGNKTYPQLVITLVLGGGSLPQGETVSVNAGFGIGELPVATLEGYRLIGYFVEDAEAPVTADTMFDVNEKTVTLTARWQKQVTITFNPDEGTFTNAGDATRTIDENTAIGALPEVRKDGYGFLGWYDGEERITAEKIFATDKTLVAKWEIIPDDTVVTFDAGEGTVQGEASKNVPVGTPIGTLPSATRVGYRFVAWLDPDGTEVTEQTVFERSEITLTARYLLQTVITFDAGAGTIVGNAEKSIDAGTAAGELPTATSTVAGEVFDRWVDGNGNTVTAESVFGAETTAVTLTAKYGWDGTTVSESLTGEGTAESPYLIGSGADLQYFAENVTAGVYKLTKDINLAGKTWASTCATSATAFAGTFDGDGHKIEGLTRGLFVYLGAGTVKNLSLDVNITNTAGNTGALALTVSGTATVTNVNVYGSVTGAANLCGGFFGVVQAVSTITNCTNYATVTNTGSKSMFTGGIVGSVTEPAAGTQITGCVNRGTVTSAGQHVGGITGMVRKAAATISGCYNYGDVTGTGQVGGLVGILRANLINSYCYSEALINNKTASQYNEYGNRTTVGGGTSNGYIAGQIDDKAGQVDSYEGNGLCDEEGEPPSGEE